MDFTEVSPELMERAKACTTVEEIFELAKEHGYELSDEQLEAIAGGDNEECPQHEESWRCSINCVGRECTKVCTSATVATINSEDYGPDAGSDFDGPLALM